VSNDYPLHPLAKLFPVMPEDSFAYAAFRESFRTQGPGTIALHQGMVLTGVHDLRACRDLGIDPPFREYDGDDPLGFVLSRNLTQPHWTPAQLALFVERNTTWSTHGGNRKGPSGRKMNGVAVFGALLPYAKPGADLASLLPISFDSVRKLHSAICRRLRDENGKNTNTTALLPEIIESIESGKTETVGKVRWLADQPHESQRLYLKSVTVSGILIALAKHDFEARLIEGGGLVIADLRYKHSQGLRLRAPPPQLADLVFANADRIGRWLERDERRMERAS
jgi:hypothetical protein